MCFACRSVAQRLGAALAPVFPVRLCPLPSPLYTVLVGYKEAPVDEARERYAPMVRKLLAHFAAEHAPCLAAAAGGTLHAVLPVPSTARPGGAPLARVPGLAAAVCAQLGAVDWLPRALVRAEAPVGHMRPDADAFTVLAAARDQVAGRRVVVLDDTYVSGARAQSAAVALRHAGARGVVIMVVGRVLRPGRSALHGSFLSRQRGRVPQAGAAPGAQAGGGPRVAAPCCRCVQTPAVTE